MLFVQDSCMSYSCWVTLNSGGCSATPWATCPLARQQMDMYAALAKQCPRDTPPCGVCVEDGERAAAEAAAQKALRDEKARRSALGGKPGQDDDDCSLDTALGPFTFFYPGSIIR